MRYPGFCGGSYISQSYQVDQEDTINWYYEQIESPYAKSRAALYPTEGFQSYASVSDVGGRALATMNGRTFGVMGAGVYELFVTQTSSKYGTVAQDSNPAQFAFNGKVGNQALIASGTNGYNLDLGTNTLSQVLTGKATQAGMLDGYGIAFDNSTGRIWLSNLNDFTTWDPTQFVARTTSPDSWKAMIVNPPDVWLIGSLSGDVWYDAGTFPFPLAARTGLNFKYGIVAPFSLASYGQSILWLSQTSEGAGVVVRTQGYQPVRISNYAIETAIAQYARTSGIGDAESFVYQNNGHVFYVLRFPAADATWVYDLSSADAGVPSYACWHKRGYWNVNANTYNAWKVRVHTFAFGQHLVADPSTGTIAKMDTSIATELDGSAIRRLRRSPAIFAEDRPNLIRRIEFLMEQGSSLQTGQGSNATVMYRNSDDGGKTWGNQRTGSIGLVGQYRQPGVRFVRCGVPRNRVDEIVVTDPITSWRVTDAYINNDGPRGGQQAA